MRRVELPSGGWAELRDHLSWAQQQRMDTAGTKYVRDAEGRLVAADEHDVYEHFVVLMELWIASWSLPFPIGRAGIEHEDFTVEDGDFLFEQIREQRAASQRSKSGAD